MFGKFVWMCSGEACDTGQFHFLQVPLPTSLGDLTVQTGALRLTLKLAEKKLKGKIKGGKKRNEKEETERNEKGAPSEHSSLKKTRF